MAKGILGRKLGMTQIFDAAGNLIPVTIIDAYCLDGYSAGRFASGSAQTPCNRKLRFSYFSPF